MAGTTNNSRTPAAGGSTADAGRRPRPPLGCRWSWRRVLPASVTTVAPQLAPPTPLLYPVHSGRCRLSAELSCRAREAHPDKVPADMSRNGKNPKLELRLDLSAHLGGPSGVAGTGSRNVRDSDTINNNISPHHSSSSSSSPTSSPPSSCVSSETDLGRCSSSPEATSMMLVGCPRCLMYVMLSEDDPKCPKCKSTVLLDFLNDPKNAPATSSKPRKK